MNIPLLRRIQRQECQLRPILRQASNRLITMWTNNSHDFDFMEREIQLHEDRRIKYPNDLATAIEGPLDTVKDLLADDAEPTE